MSPSSVLHAFSPKGSDTPLSWAKEGHFQIKVGHSQICTWDDIPELCLKTAKFRCIYSYFPTQVKTLKIYEIYTQWARCIKNYKIWCVFLFFEPVVGEKFDILFIFSTQQACHRRNFFRLYRSHQGVPMPTLTSSRLGILDSRRDYAPPGGLCTMSPSPFSFTTSR